MKTQILLLFLVLCGVSINAQGKSDMKSDSFDITCLREGLVPIWQGGEHQSSQVEYFQYYGLDIKPRRYEHFFGTFDSNDFSLAAHIYRPREYKATVVIVHGYLEHCGLLSKLIKFLLEDNFAVAVFDLPGNGLSSGASADIEDFSQYTQSLKDFLAVLEPHMAKPYHLIGFSTGGSCTIDYLLMEKGEDFDKVILAAPLVRSVFWDASKIGYKFGQIFGKDVKRIFRRVSSDDEFLQFIKNKDPLQARKVPFRWTKALYDWNDRIADAKASEKPIFVIQGRDDKIVDYKFNIRFIRSKFPNAQIKFIENGRHELFNESIEIREEVFSQIKRNLSF